MLTAAIIAAKFNVTITRTLPVGAINESEDSDLELARIAGAAILEGKGDEALEVHEMVDGFIVAGQRNAVLIGNDGAHKLLSQKATTEDADETLIGSWKGKSCDNDTFVKATKGITPSLGSEGDLNFIKYSGKDGNMVGAVVKGKDGADRYLIPVPKAAESVEVDAAMVPALRQSVKQAIAFLKAGKTTEAAVALGKTSERLSGTIPTKLKESKAIAAQLTEAAEAVEENPAEAMALLHEAYMAIASDQSPYDPDAPFSIYGNSVSFRADTFIAKTPDYSVANFVMGTAIKEVMGGPLGRQLAKAVAVALSKSPKVKALDIELREVKLKESLDESATDESENIHDAEALRARIKEFHDRINPSLSEKLGPDDDASVFLGGNSNSNYKEYIDARFHLGQKLERDNSGGIGKWVDGVSQGAGTGLGDEKDVRESVDDCLTEAEAAKYTAGQKRTAALKAQADTIKNLHAKFQADHGRDATQAEIQKHVLGKKRSPEEVAAMKKHLAGTTEAADDIDTKKKGVFPGEGNGTVSPYAGKDDDEDDKDGAEGTGEDPDETVAVVIKGGKGLELRVGYDGDGAVLASEECDAEDGDDAKEALGRLASKAQSLGYVYVPANMKEDADTGAAHYAALANVLVPMIGSPAVLEHCRQWIEAYEKGVAEDDATLVLTAAKEIAKKVGKEIPEGLIEGLSHRAHKVGRRPLIKSRFKLKGFGKPKGKTGPGSSGQHTTIPAGKRGIHVHEGEGKVSSQGKTSDTFKAPSDPLRQTGPGAKGGFANGAPSGGPKGLNVAKGKVSETDDHEQCKAGDFVSYNGDPHVIASVEKGGKSASIVPVKLEKDGAWGKTGAAINASTSEMNFLKKGKANAAESTTHDPLCPECASVEVTETTAGCKCCGCGYSASKIKFTEADTNQEGPVKLNTASIKKAKTPGPQNLLPPGNTPPNAKTEAAAAEGTAKDQMNKQCACPNCENTQDITITGKTIKCNNCDYKGTAADFQLPTSATDTVESWITKVRDMSVEEFVDDVGEFAGTATTEAFKDRMDAVVEAWKTGPGKKNLARKITAVNPLVKRKLGKGISLESVQATTDEGTTTKVTFPKGRVDEFLLAAREAGSVGEGEVEMIDNSVVTKLPREIGDKVRALFRGDDVTYENIA